MQSEIKIEKHHHIPQLDGLRGIAIIMVMCYHFFPNNIICNFGWSGVDLFFVLSGFLITGRLVPYLDDQKILFKFYRNRFLRIVPLYFGFLILFFTGWFFISSKATLNTHTFYNNHWWEFFLFIQNWVFANNLAETKPYLQHLWSIAVEEQMYIIYPFLLIAIRNKTKLFISVIFIITLIIISRWYYYNFLIPKEEYLRVFYNSFFRFDAFLAGALVYLIHNTSKLNKARITLNWLGLVCFLVLISYFFITKDTEKNNPFISGGGYTIIAIMYASILQLTLSKSNKFINSITSFSFLKSTGKISYAMYIFHWPLFLVLFALLNKVFTYLNVTPSYTATHVVNALICIPATYILSHISFKFFESYFLKRKISPFKQLPD